MSKVSGMWTAQSPGKPLGSDPSGLSGDGARAGQIFADAELEVKSSAIPRGDGRNKKTNY